MQRNQILQAAVRRNLNMEQIGGNCKSAFSLVHQCMASICTMNSTEEEKKEKLIRSLQSFWRGKSQRIEGCKREHIQKIVKSAFGIGSERSDCLKTEINIYTFQELYLYYCYIERMAQADTYFSEIIKKSCNSNRNNKTAIQKIEERQRAEENQEKKINEMSKEEKWRHDIFDKQQDMDMQYYQSFIESDTYGSEDKMIIAGLLKEYWTRIGKWKGNKVSKKQIIKISEVNKILELHENL